MLWFPLTFALRLAGCFTTHCRSVYFSWNAFEVLTCAQSEGSWGQNSGPRNTNIIRHRIWDEFAIQNEVQLTTQTYQCKWCGYMEWKWIVLPWEISWTWRDKFELRLKQDLSWEVSRYHSTRRKKHHRGRVEPQEVVVNECYQNRSKVQPTSNRHRLAPTDQ